MQGWHTAAYFSEEIHAPERNVVRSVFGGIALVTALYVLVNAAMLHVLSPEQMAASKLPATSERSLLTVLLPARDLRQSLVPNLQRAVQQLLIVLGIPPEIVSREIAAMQPAAFAGAVNRRVLGSMNEFAWQVGAYLDRTNDALELARQLSDTPMSAVGIQVPSRYSGGCGP